MANLADNSGDASSNLVAGNGTNSARFTMPGNIALQVESVVATVDNGAGADTLATLVVKDQSGVVIATTAQGETIPAGNTGTATFALRLAKGSGGIRFNKANVGGYLQIETTGANGSGNGFQFVSERDVSWTLDNATYFTNTGGGLWELDTQGGTVQFNPNGGSFQVNNSGGDVDVSCGSAGSINLFAGSMTLGRAVLIEASGGLAVFRTTDDRKVGFFGATPVVKQATPVTLGDVIALLQAYGLAA